jgi:hypothetical protein
MADGSVRPAASTDVRIPPLVVAAGRTEKSVAAFKKLPHFLSGPASLRCMNLGEV